MNTLRRRLPLSALMTTALAVSFAAALTRAQEQPAVTEVTPNVLVFATSSGNVVASVGPDGALLVGTPSAASTPAIEQVLRLQTNSPVRYVVIFPQSANESEGDAGWKRLGAFVAMQENALRRISGDQMGAPGHLPERLVKLGVDRPHIAFDHVLAFDLNGEAIHVVHQESGGYSDADAVAHFHVAHVVYLGEVFPGDGYPRIDTDQGGTLKGLIAQLSWTDPSIRVVPARGRVTDGSSVKAFVDMITTVRDRLQHMIDARKTEDQILASHPTSDFDARWGHGRVSPDEFVREVYSALKKQ